MIRVVDYGLGNVQAFLNVYRRLNIPAGPARTADDIGDASRIILPGVGHFDHAMDRLVASGMRQALDRAVVQRSVPVLGVCVGMQIMAGVSEEGERAGLGWIDGHVKGFGGGNGGPTRLPVPHMGWNDVRPVSAGGLFQGLEDGARFYFLHSFFLECDDHAVLAVSEYGADFTCAVQAGNIYGLQFHPEKSHGNGIQILKNFAQRC